MFCLVGEEKKRVATLLKSSLIHKFQMHDAFIHFSKIKFQTRREVSDPSVIMQKQVCNENQVHV